MADSNANPDENKLKDTPGAHPKGDASPGKGQQSSEKTERLEEMLSRVELTSTNQVQPKLQHRPPGPGTIATGDEEPMETEQLDKSVDPPKSSNKELGEQGPDIFHALHPLKDKWPLRREDDIPNEERENTWKHTDVTCESDPLYDPEFDSTYPIVKILQSIPFDTRLDMQMVW